MVGGVSMAASRIDFNPTDPTDIPAATVQAKLQVAALKSQQDIMRMQGEELARLIEPNKGTNIDARA